MSDVVLGVASQWSSRPRPIDNSPRRCSSSAARPPLSAVVDGFVDASLMEVPYDFSDVFDAEPIQRLDRHALIRLNPRKCWAVQKAIDQMGILSAQAQGLRRVLTSYDKVVDHDEEQVIYLMWRKDQSRPNTSHIIGLLKVGRKRLFLLNQAQQQFDTTPICLLDFYVYENRQRQGNGHVLYEHMLQAENTSAAKIAIDRPSESLIQFAHKHYGLTDPIWQSTNYAVYAEFFEDIQPVNDPRGWKTGPSDKARAGGFRPSTAPVFPLPSAPRSPRRGGGMLDSASGLIHGGGDLPVRQRAAPDTPQGRKNIRDFGHQNIW